MKKIIIIMISLICSAGTFAQQKGFGSPHVHVYTRIYVAPAYGLGLNYGYPLFGYPYFGYMYPYGYPPYPYMPPSSYKLNAQISAVKSEYKYQIKTVRKDESISKTQKKQDILQLKSERENAIAEVEKNYHKRPVNHQGTNNSQKQTNDSSNS